MVLPIISSLVRRHAIKLSQVIDKLGKDVQGPTHQKEKKKRNKNITSLLR